MMNCSYKLSEQQNIQGEYSVLQAMLRGDFAPSAGPERYKDTADIPSYNKIQLLYA